MICMNKIKENDANMSCAKYNTHNSHKIICGFSALLFAVITLFTASCGGNDYDKRTITVTIEPLRYFTEQIAGNKFDVVSMVPKGGNPETYEPTARQMADLSVSELYIKVGQIGFERTWMKTLQKYAPHTIVIDSSTGLKYMNTINGRLDPHTWMSTVNAITITNNIYKALALIDWKDSMTFKHNLETLQAKIENIDTQIRESITKDKSTAFLIYHPTLSYFARDYKFIQIPIEEEGREPSAAQIERTIQLAKSKNVKTIFIQKQFSSKNAELVNQYVNAKKVTINPLNYHWDEEMTNIAKSLR
jgi:zinc transport system substrate-binding protein